MDETRNGGGKLHTTYIHILIFVLLEVLYHLVTRKLKSRNKTFIHLVGVQIFFGEIALLLNGSYFVRLELTLHPFKLNCSVLRKFKRWNEPFIHLFGI